MKANATLLFLASTLSALACRTTPAKQDNSSLAASQGSMTELTVYKPEGCTLDRIAISPRNREFAISTSRFLVEAWDLKTKKSLWTGNVNFGFSPISFYHEQVWAVDFPSDGKSVIVAGGDMLETLSVVDGSRISLIDYPHQLHPTTGVRKIPFFTAIASSPDGRLLGTANIWNKKPEVVDPASVGIWTGASAAARKTYDQSIIIWNRETNKIEREIPTTDSVIRTVQFSKDQEIIYTVSYRKVSFYKAATGAKIVEFDASTLATETQAEAPENAMFASAAVSTDLRFVAVSMLSGIAILSSETLKILTTYAHTSALIGFARQLSFTDNLCCLEATDLAGHFYSWRIADGKVVYRGSTLAQGVFPGFGSSIGPGVVPFGKVAYDPVREFILEEEHKSPPLDTSSDTPPPLSPCAGFRQVSLPKPELQP